MMPSTYQVYTYYITFLARLQMSVSLNKAAAASLSPSGNPVLLYNLFYIPIIAILKIFIIIHLTFSCDEIIIVIS